MPGPPAAIVRHNVAPLPVMASSPELREPVMASSPELREPSFDYGFSLTQDDGDGFSDTESTTQRYVFFPFGNINIFTTLSLLFHYCFLALFPLYFL
jgi:hypothetical protein